MENQIYLIKSGDNQFVEETEALLIASGGNIGIGSATPTHSLHVDGSGYFNDSLKVGDVLNIGGDGKVGGQTPQEDYIIVWDGAKWVADENAGGIAGGSAIVTSLTPGSSTYSIAFPSTYDAVPAIATDLSIDGTGPIIPYTIQNITRSGYEVVFAHDIPNSNYSIHTVFGGNVILSAGGESGLAAYWTGSSPTSIYYNGDVGIGTTNPDSKLHLEGAATVDARVTLEQTTANLKAEIQQGSAGFALSAIGNQSLLLQTNGLERLRIDSSGNVGIGTADPKRKLHISENPVIVLSDTTGDESEIPHHRAILNNLNLLNFGKYNSTFTSFDSHLVIDSDGDVGIGTANPQAPLHISKTHSDAFDGIDNFIILAASEKPGQDLVRDDGVGILFKIPVSTETQSVGARIAAVREGTTDSNSSTDLVFQVSNNDQVLDEAMRIDRDGNVGIGTKNPNYRLDVREATNGAYAARILNNGGDSYGLLVKTSSGTSENFPILDLENVSSNVFRVQSNGNVGIGASVPGNLLELRTANGSGRMAEISVYSDGTNNSATSSIFLGQSLTRRAEITAIRTGSGNSHELAFSTNAGAAAPVEAMRIDSAGNVGIGTTVANTIVSATTAINAFAFIKNVGYGTFTSNSSGPGLYINKTNASTSQSTDYINFRNKGTKVGGIEYDGTDVQLVQTSDARLKENIQDSESGLSLVNNFKVRSFDWVESKRQSKKFGFVAQEMHEVFEDAVKVGGEDENEDPWGIYDSKLIPVLAKAIQEQQTIIEDLKSRIAVLEGGAPTTEAPTTEAPTTEAPTTEAPTTEAPTTEAPTTEAPTTEAPDQQ
tara:strand:+ start:12480 stop:14960 length:2481 start_codon:yes stop_codon:yes gene_type:complete